MADNLTVSITADSTKLRADLAIAQESVKQFATELRKAAAESLKSGDTEAVKVAAANYDDAKGKVDGLRGSLSNLTKQHQEHETALQQTGRALGNVRTRFGELQGSVGHLADNVFPHFREVLALSVGAAVVELTRKIIESNAALREQQNLARALGVTADHVEALELVGAKAGTEMGTLARTFARLAVSVGDASERLITASGELPGPVSVLAGNMKHLGDQGVYAAGSLHQVNESIFGGVQVARGGVKQTIDFTKAFDDLISSFQNGPKDANATMKLYTDIIERLNKIPDATVRARVAQQTLGRGWFESAGALDGFKSKFVAAQHDIEEAFGKEIALARLRANAFNASKTVAQSYFEKVKQVALAALGQGLVPFFEESATLLKNNVSVIREWATTAGDYIGRTFQDLVGLLNGQKLGTSSTGLSRFLRDAADQASRLYRIFSAAFNAIRAILDGLAVVINRVFGTQLTGDAIGAAIVVAKVTGAIGLLSSSISFLVSVGRGLVAVFQLMTATPVGLILTALALLALVVYKNWDTLGPLFKSLWDLLKAIAAWVGDAFTNAWTTAVTWIEDLFNGLWNWIKGVFDKIIEAAKNAASWVAKALGINSGGSTDQTGQTLAGGGHVRGAGTSTSDSIRAWLSDGEFVNRAKSVSYYGVDFFRALNAMAVPKPSLGFAAGGLVSVGSIMPPSPRFASGGLVAAAASPSRTLNLTIGAETFAGLTAPETVATRLETVATRQRMRSAGKKPSWFGGR